MKILKLLLTILGALLLFACSDEEITYDFGNDQEKSSKDVTIYVTTGNREYEFAKDTIPFVSNPNLAPNTIKIDPSIRYQTIHGFGAAITGSTAYNLMQMTPENRRKFLIETFSVEEGMGYSYMRVPIGCSDFSLTKYTHCDEEGIENFKLHEEDVKYVIPVLQEILEINPNVKIMGSPWTAPRWMKGTSSNSTSAGNYPSWTGRRLMKIYYEDYGLYFVKWIQALAEYGIKVHSITPQNEPLNMWNHASMRMDWTEQRDFVKTGLGPQLKKAGLSNVNIYCFDHNFHYDNMSAQKEYPVKIYQDEEASQYITGAAYHAYGGPWEELNNIHEQHPEKELIFTEASIGDWCDGRNLNIRLVDDMESLVIGATNKWCTGVILWNLMLDLEGRPNQDEPNPACYGSVDIDQSNYETITKNSHYFVIGHASAVVRPGAVRIASSGYTADGLYYGAYENVDGTIGFMLTNKSDESRNITLDDGKNSVFYKVPPKSVVSYLWKK